MIWFINCLICFLIFTIASAIITIFFSFKVSSNYSREEEENEEDHFIASDFDDDFWNN